MTVYCLLEHVSHEGSSLLGVYATKEGAMKAAQRRERDNDLTGMISYPVQAMRVKGINNSQNSVDNK